MKTLFAICLATTLGLSGVQSAQQEGNPEAAKIAREGSQAAKDQDWNKAIERLRKAAEMDRKYTQSLALAYQQRAFSYANDQRFQDALNDLGEAIRINPRDARTFEQRAAVEMRINDYDKALALAKQQHKPILIDFTGWACVNCRKMEENVWPEDIVKDKIREDYILVSLYVDDRKVLPDDQQFLFTTGDGSKKEIRTVGDKFATLQSENFKNASQPFYVVISPDEKLLNYPVGYTPNAKEYAAWLQCGLDAYKKQ